MNSKISVHENRLREISALYLKEKSASAVARKLGYTRQHIAKLLDEADRLGLVDYRRGRSGIKVTKTAARAALKDTGSVISASAMVGLSTSTFSKRFSELIHQFKLKSQPKRNEVQAEILRGMSLNLKERRAWAKAHDICTMCLRQSTVNHRSTCLNCSSSAVARKARLREKGEKAKIDS